MSRLELRWMLVPAAAFALGCATAPPATLPDTAPNLPDAATAHTLVPTGPTVNDPFESFNRSMFWFNDRLLDRWIYGPLAHGWMYVTPLTVRVHLEQFVDNLNFPGYFVQPLLQGDPVQSGVALARFGINSTVGVVGIFDPANYYLGLARRQEDMGQTFGVWGIGPGPYLSLPLVAPTSCVRDVVGLPFDWILNVGDSYFWPWFAPYGETLVRDVNRRALIDENLNAARDAAVDWYSSARDAYLQHREVAIRNGEAKEGKTDDDLYNVEDTPSSTK